MEDEEGLAQKNFEATIIMEIKKGTKPDDIIDKYGFDKTQVWATVFNLIKEGKLKLVVK